MEAEACEIARLPEELLSLALARTSPRDACRAAAASPAFRAAADSDAVWACFLPRPRDLPPLADGELPTAPTQPLPRKKDLFLRLSDGPLLLSDKLVSMWLDRETGARCYMLSARQLSIVWGDTPQYWSWIPLADSRFSEGAQLMDVCWFEIRGKIPRKMLSQDTVYAVYLVHKVIDRSVGLNSPFPEASVSIGGTDLTRKVCFKGYDDEVQGDGVPENYWPMGLLPRQRTRRRNGRAVPHGENVTLPQKRADSWMELELGEFFNEGGEEDGEVSFSLMETKGGNWKSGLIVQGIGWASSDGVSTESETKVHTPGLDGGGSVDVWLTCEPKPTTTSSGELLRSASPFESEDGTWLIKREFFAMGAGVCDGPLDNPPDKLTEVAVFVAVIGLTAEELLHLSMLGFRSFSFPARAFLPVLSLELLDWRAE